MMRINSRFSLQMTYISLKFSSFLFAAHVFGLATGGQGPNIGVIIDTNGDQIIFLNFMPYSHSVLNVSTIGSKFVANVEDCQALCMNTPRCLSVNVATLNEDEQRLSVCQMLATTKNSEPDRFGPSVTFHHYNTVVSDPSSVIPQAFAIYANALIDFK